MSSWAPSAEGVQQLLSLFQASQGADNAQHRAIQQQLTSFNAIVCRAPRPPHRPHRRRSAPRRAAPLCRPPGRAT